MEAGHDFKGHQPVQIACPRTVAVGRRVVESSGVSADFPRHFSGMARDAMSLPGILPPTTKGPPTQRASLIHELLQHHWQPGFNSPVERQATRPFFCS